MYKQVSFVPNHNPKMTAGSPSPTRRPPSSFRERKDSIASSIVSVDDIMTWAERTRVSSAKQSRIDTLEVIQSYMFRDPKRISRPHTCKERKLPGKERPLTARSLCSEPPPPVTTPVAFSLLSDEEDGLERQATDAALLSQQCCELFGPNMCQVCAKMARAYKQRQRYEHNFRGLQVTEQNFTTATLVKKNMPQLTMSQIHDRVAAGDVSQQQLRRLHEVRESPEEMEKRRADKESQEQALLNRRRSKGSYSLREMNRRLAAGDTGFRKKKQTRLYVTESLFPSFVSPRKVKQYIEPIFRVYYEPPLVAKHRQKSEPTFFAGSSGGYKLPDRLPDKIVFTKINSKRERTKSVEKKPPRSHSPSDPLDYEATYIDSVDNLIKQYLNR